MHKGGAFRSHIGRMASRIWRGIREWCGDAAYERYLKVHEKHECGAPALSREDFYVQQLQKRYSRVSRCC